MDNPSEDTPGTEQKPPQADNAAYQQYLDSDAQKSAKSRKKMIILIAAGVLALFAVIIIVALLFGRKDEPSRQPQAVVVVCTDEDCFNDHFLQCLPAIYTYDESPASVKYSITGDGEVGCNVSMEYLKAQYSPEVVGKSMTCDFDNNVEFQTAAENVFRFPDDYACQGDLANFFRDNSDVFNGS